MKPFVIEEGKWRIHSDEECYVLQKARTVKGRPKWEGEGYYVTLADCLAGCLRKNIRGSEEELPQALQEAVETIEMAAVRLRQGLCVIVNIPLKEGLWRVSAHTQSSLPAPLPIHLHQLTLDLLGFFRVEAELAEQEADGKIVHVCLVSGGGGALQVKRIGWKCPVPDLMSPSLDGRSATSFSPT